MAIIKKFLLLCLVIFLGAFPAWSATHNVSNVTQLTNALSNAAAGDIINLSAGTYSLTSELTINKNITLKGNTASDTIIERSSSAASKFRNINISGSAVILQNLTIQNASYDQNGAGIYYNASGTLSIDNCIITNNQSSTPGGGIYNDNGTANITNCTITGNNASYGGGFFNNGTATITNCTITDNTANKDGDGIYNYSAATITNCTITGNTANNGGKEIYQNSNNNGTLSALNTLIWNSSNVIYGTLTLTNCAVPSGITGTDLVTLTSWANPVSSSVEVDGVTHTVFTIENNTELQALVGKGIKSGDQTPATDQIGTLRANPPTIGAIEKKVVEPITISCDVDTLENYKGLFRRYYS